MNYQIKITFLIFNVFSTVFLLKTPFYANTKGLSQVKYLTIVKGVAGYLESTDTKEKDGFLNKYLAVKARRNFLHREFDR